MLKLHSIIISFSFYHSISFARTWMVFALISLKKFQNRWHRIKCRICLQNCSSGKDVLNSFLALQCKIYKDNSRTARQRWQIKILLDHLFSLIGWTRGVDSKKSSAIYGDEATKQQRPHHWSFWLFGDYSKLHCYYLCVTLHTTQNCCNTLPKDSISA